MKSPSLGPIRVKSKHMIEFMDCKAVKTVVVGVLVVGAGIAWGNLSLERPTPLKTFKADRSEVRWNNLYAESVRYTHITRLIFQDTLTVTTNGRSSGSYSTVDYNLLSVVGPVVSYRKDTEADGGAHPTSHSRHVAVDLRTKLQPASITVLFDEKEVLMALLRNKIIAEMDVTTDVPSSLSDLLRSLPSYGCKKLNSMDALFCISDIGDDRAVVWFLPDDDGEFCRGSNTTIEIEVPIPSGSAGWFRTAREQGAYAKAMIKNGT